MLKNTKCVTYHLNQTLLFVLKTLIDLQNISVDVVYYMCFKINFTFPKLILDKMSLQNFKLPTSCIRKYLCTLLFPTFRVQNYLKGIIATLPFLFLKMYKKVHEIKSNSKNYCWMGGVQREYLYFKENMISQFFVINFSRKHKTIN